VSGNKGFSKERSSDVTKKDAIIGFFVLLTCSVLPAGCDNSGEKAARAEVEEAKNSLLKVKTDLVKAQGAIADLKEEMDAVRKTRDELDLLVQQLTTERDKALVQARKAQDAMEDTVARFSDGGGALNALQSEIEKLKTTIAQQQNTIAEQQATIEQLVSSAGPKQAMPEGPAEPVGPAEPNEPNEAP
jgi:chromosome segregation ATPase